MSIPWIQETPEYISQKIMPGNFENRRYVFFPMTSVSEINFDEVLEDSEETLRKNLDETFSFVKYDGEMPSSIQNLTGRGEPLDRQSALSILSQPDWTPDIDL